MTTAETLFWIALAVFGTIDSALWSGLETGSYVVSRLGLETRLGDPKHGASARRLKRELDHPQRALATLLVMNNLSNYLGALALAALLNTTDLPGWAIALINVAVLTPVLFIFAETLPKEVFRTRADRLMYIFVPVLTFCRTVLTFCGIVPVILLIMRGVGAALGSKPLEANPRDRLAGLIEEAAGVGVLSDEQAKLLDRAAAFRDTTVGDEMTPWARVRRVREGVSIADARRIVADGQYARLPVTDATGRVRGVVRTIDVLDPAGPGLGSLTGPLILPVPEVEPGAGLITAMRVLRAAGSPIAVVSSGGRPVGLITLKDLVEPLTGELAAW
ncbi:MAG: CNNM domain-containing protein [Phycisphaerales bacterium]